MNKNSVLTVVFAGLTFLSGCRDNKALEKGYDAVVSENYAYFRFPVDNAEGTWIWNFGPDSVLNYAWMVQVKLSGESIEFGYSNFKYDGTSQTKGTLDMLLMSGQVNFWENRKYVGGQAGLKAFRDKSSVVIFMDGGEYLEQFQGECPKEVLLKTDGNMIYATRVKVPVKYEINEPGQ